MRIQGIFSYLTMTVALAIFGGCVSEGYSFAIDSNIVRKWDVIITDIEFREIINTPEVFWVGPFESGERRGLKITFREIDDGKTTSIIQPLSWDYHLQVGQRAAYIADRGQVWIQPTDYPLPSDFSAAGTGKPRNK